MEETTDYSIFKFRVENRDINRHKIDMLKSSFSRRDKSGKLPIIVNSEMQIMDGQHRFYALQELGKPIYYIKDDEFTLEDMALINSAQSGWKTQDWIKYWGALKGEPYVTFKRLSEEYGVAGSDVARDLTSENGNRVGKRVVAGTCPIPSPERLEQVETSYKKSRTICDELSNSSIRKSNLFKSTIFFRAVKSIVKIPGVDSDLLLEKLLTYTDKIQKRVACSGYIRQIADIYNIYNRNPIKVDDIV